MRNNNLKDLYVDYPFLPVVTAPAWFKSVKYMRITVVLDAFQPTEMGRNGNFITATLTGISPTKVYVNVTCQQYSWNHDYEIDVFTGTIPSGNNYVYTDSELPTLTGLSYQIHPDCMVFQQIAPTLHMEKTTSSSSPVMQLEKGASGISQWLFADLVASELVDGVLRLANGHNVDVSGSSDTVLFTGTPGAGIGQWVTAPYSTEGSSFDGFRGKGLRSINGKTGHVLITGDRSVAVDRGDGDNTLAISPVYEDGGAQE